MSRKAKLITMILVSVAILGIYLFLCMGYVLYPIKYQENIETYCEEYSVDKTLIASLINVESHFNENAVSVKGAKGLMQIMPMTAKWLAEKLDIEYSDDKLFDADFNIKIGTYYIHYLSTKFKDEEVMLCAYNAGEGTVRTWLNDAKYFTDGETLNQIPYKETKEYIEKIAKNKKIYNKKMTKNAN